MPGPSGVNEQSLRLLSLWNNQVVAREIENHEQACGGKSIDDAQPRKPAVDNPLVANTRWHRLFIGSLMGHTFSRFVLRTSSGHSNSFRSVSNPHGSLGRFCAVWASVRSSPRAKDF